jgi:hypothetical protein
MAGLGIPPGSVDELFALVVTDPTVVGVRATRPDGSVDEMAPVDGSAVLVTRSGWAVGRGVEAFAADGRPVVTC